MVNGSHFLGGTITWQLQNKSAIGTPVAVVITQTYSWTYTSVTCTSAMIANNQLLPTSAGNLICLPSCPVGFGTVPATPYCTDISVINGITVGQRLDTVYIPTVSNFSVAFRGSAWGSLATGGSGWSILSHINLALRTDNGKYNSAPVTTMMSPINIIVHERTIITVPVSDTDGDVLRCRWATSSNGVDECASVCPPSSLPSNTTIYSNCTIEITGNTVGNKYAVGLMVEDFINSTSTVSLSSVPVQFIVKVIAAPSCSYRPELILLAESCTPIKVNHTFTSTLLAINNCGPTVTITDISTLSFSGMVQTSVIMLNSSVYYKNLTWTPTISQVGYQVMCALALNSQSSQSSQYCFTFYVTENGDNTCPGVIYNTTTEIVTTTTTTTSTTMSEISTTGNANLWPLFGSLIDNDAGGKVITNIPVPKDETTPIVINLNVQSPNLASKQEKKKKGLPIVDLHSNKSGQTSLMNMKTKRRSNSFDEQLPKQQHPKHTHKKRIARRSSAGDIDHVRVTHIHAHPIATQTLPIDDIRPSIIENTIRLDDIKKNVQSEPLMETNDSKIYVKTAPSHTLRTTGEPRPSQIDTIHLTSTSSKLNISTASADNNDKNTPKGVHVKHIKMQKKKTYTTTAVTPLQSLIEEEKKETDDHE
ncbi:unnamed protein product [Rotaria sp. Silwood1]|nr:unnamed protein product [Rotaria sp. Silwood1]